jgi:hypothetical protein
LDFEGPDAGREYRFSIRTQKKRRLLSGVYGCMQFVRLQQREATISSSGPAFSEKAVSIPFLRITDAGERSFKN